MVFTFVQLLRTIFEGFRALALPSPSRSWECRMRLVRLVVAGIVLGAVGGYLAALLRPRTVHRNLVADGFEREGGFDPAPLPERSDGEPLTELPFPVEARL